MRTLSKFCNTREINISVTRGHTLFLNNTIVARCALDVTVLLAKYLTKVGNRLRASPKMRPVGEQRLAIRVQLTSMAGVREDKRIGGELRSAAKPEPRDSGPHACAVRVRPRASATTVAASNSHQSATRPREGEPTSDSEREWCRLSESARH